VRPVVLVGGTWSYADPMELRVQVAEKKFAQLPWCHPRSRFAEAARAQGVRLASDDEPFLWTTDLEMGGKLEEWWAGAAALAYYCRWLAGGIAPVHIVAHSHGGQVAAMAVGRFGVPCDTLITLATPVRRDMQRHRRAARAYARRWIHVYSPEDPVQLAGEVLSGGDPTLRDLPEFGVENMKETMPEFAPLQRDAHSALHDPERWTRNGWWTWLTS
jgi:hypothetical protein